MTTVASLQAQVIEVVPGAEAACRLEIRNGGSIVESYQLEVLGEAAGWTTMQPETVSLVPGDGTAVTLHFHPPRSARVTAGDLEFAVRIIPANDPAAGAVPEGIVRVLPFADASAELRPRASTGRSRARHDLAVDNRGNIPAYVEISADDPDESMVLTPEPATLQIGADQAQFAKVAVKHRKLLWRGQPQTKRFQVLVQPEQGPPIALEGTTVQQPLFSRGATRALAALLVLALASAGLWFGLLKPTITSAAGVAAKEAAEAAVKQALPQGGSQPNPPVESTPEPGEPEPPAEPPVVTTPMQHVFDRTVDKGKTRTTDPIKAPDNSTLVITDLVLQNPQGDSGQLEILVNGNPAYLFAMQNFRTDVIHLVSPIHLTGDNTLQTRVFCQTGGGPIAGQSPDKCRTRVTVSGYTRTQASQ